MVSLDDDTITKNILKYKYEKTKYEIICSIFVLI